MKKLIVTLFFCLSTYVSMGKELHFRDCMPGMPCYEQRIQTLSQNTTRYVNSIPKIEKNCIQSKMKSMSEFMTDAEWCTCLSETMIYGKLLDCPECLDGIISKTDKPQTTHCQDCIKQSFYNASAQCTEDAWNKNCFTKNGNRICN